MWSAWHAGGSHGCCTVDSGHWAQQVLQCAGCLRLECGMAAGVASKCGTHSGELQGWLQCANPLALWKRRFWLFPPNRQASASHRSESYRCLSGPPKKGRACHAEDENFSQLP